MNVTEQNWADWAQPCTMELACLGLRRCRKLMFPAVSEKFHYILTIMLFPTVRRPIFSHFWRLCGKICNSFSVFFFSGFAGFWITSVLSAWTVLILWLYLFIHNGKILVFIMDSYLRLILQYFIYWFLSMPSLFMLSVTVDSSFNRLYRASYPESVLIK